MSVYLKEFSTHSEYEQYINGSGAILPNVSTCTTEGHVHYNPSSPVPPTPSYESVDLGLPSGTLWAKYNVGATSETEYGNYYQYGKGADDYAVTSGESIYRGIENPLATSADTVSQVMGGQWHTPTNAQFEELTANTTYTWETNFNGSGVNGGKFTAQNGNYVFFAAAGFYNDDILHNVGSCGYCWGSTPSSKYNAYFLTFYDGSKKVSYDGRSYGYSIRGVVG